MTKKAYQTGQCPNLIPLPARVFVKRLAWVFDIMKKTVFNVAQKWP